MGPSIFHPNLPGGSQGTMWGHQGGGGHFKKIKVISRCSCWQGSVRPEPGRIKTIS